MLRCWQVVFDATYAHNSDPDVFPDVIAACASLVGCIDDAGGLTEQKETCLIMAVCMLGKWARLCSMQSSHFYESFRPLLNSLPYGMGRPAWRLLQESAGHLLF